MITTHYIAMFALFVFGVCIGFLVGFVMGAETQEVIDKKNK